MQTSFNAYQVTGSGTRSVQVMGPNPNRVAVVLGFATVATTRFSYAFGVTAADLTGISSAGAVQPLLLTRDQVGDAITQPLNVFVSVDGSAVYCGEFTLIP